TNTLATQQADAEDGDDEDSLVPKASSSAKAADREDSILWGMGGISILPHGNYPVLEVITRILLQRKQYSRLLDLLTSHLDRPENEKVWAALLRFFIYIRPDDKDDLAAFLTKLFEKYLALSSTREAAILLANIHWHVPDFVRSVL